ncbi:MAG: aminodeoxychorismate/anthranilate synthase component II [Chloroflexi bacterium]|nr:aminodeoxychorismate/anthranilate synthase component II [Chloroflexota bacterium]
MTSPRVLLIDNYDSFTYNLYQYLCELGASVTVVRNDAITVDEVRALLPEFIVISPGPGVPRDAGISVELVRALGATTPVLGVCLGHQAITEAYGGVVTRAPELMHGKASRILHDGSGLFDGLPPKFSAIRYHSLCAAPEAIPDTLEVTARSDSGVIMAIRHREFPVYGVQFHPESILTEYGKELLRNFLSVRAEHRSGTSKLQPSGDHRSGAYTPGSHRTGDQTSGLRGSRDEHPSETCGSRDDDLAGTHRSGDEDPSHPHTVLAAEAPAAGTQRRSREEVQA